jgi:hypothetical protein
VLQAEILLPCHEAVVPSTSLNVLETLTSLHLFPLLYAKASLLVLVVELCILQIEHLVEVMQYRHYDED